MSQFRVKKTYLSAILDGLNAFSALEDVQQRPPAATLCFGPQVIHDPPPQMWMAVVVWYRPPGIYHYKTITLLGVWAAGTAANTNIIMGTQSLDYTANFYNAESYFHNIRHNFDRFYRGKIGLPAEADQHYNQIYDMSRRLEMRTDLEESIQAWRENF